MRPVSYIFLDLEGLETAMDLTCIHLARHEPNRGGGWHSFHCDCGFPLGEDSQEGHSRTAIWDESVGIFWTTTRPPETVTYLPEMVLRNCCLLWLLGGADGGATLCNGAS